MNKILILADDLTGANDTGAAICKLGLSTYAVVRSSLPPKDIQAYDCISVNMGSRGLTPARSFEIVQDAMRRFATGDIRLYSKRIDSTLRGNLGAECDAMLDSRAPDGLALIVPAFPHAGRTYYGDTVYVNGVPLARTAVAKDPKCPVATSSALRLFREQSRRQTGLIALETVRTGPGVIRKEVDRLWAEGVRNILIEAVTQGDIRLVASAVFDLKQPFIAVDPGSFTAALAAQQFPCAPDIRQISHSRGRRVLAVIGSVNRISKVQTARLLSLPNVGYAMLDVEEILESESRCQMQISSALQKLKREDQAKNVLALLFSSAVGEGYVPLERFRQRDGLTMEEVSELLNSAIARAVAMELDRSEDYGGLFTTGGDITVAVCEVLKVGGLKVLEEVVPLAVRGELRLPGGRVLDIVTKGGMIGDEDATVFCVEELLRQINLPQPR